VATKPMSKLMIRSEKPLMFVGCLSEVEIAVVSMVSLAFRGRLLRTDKSSRERLVEEEA